ncbi:hypothetical protein YSY43_39080 [Paenibacillus sp. YSY-4.3]
MGRIAFLTCFILQSLINKQKYILSHDGYILGYMRGDAYGAAAVEVFSNGGPDGAHDEGS